MSILSTQDFYTGNKLIGSCSKPEFSSSDLRPEPTAEGFSSTLVLNFDPEPAPKPRSKLINITQPVPGSSKPRKILLPVFYKKNPEKSAEKLYLENSLNLTPLNEISCEQINCKTKGKKQTKATSTTFASMHTLSNLDGDLKHEIFSDKVDYEYEKELKASMTDGNFVAFCSKCQKETVCVMKNEIKSFVQLIFCCCSNLNVKSKVFGCPTCGDVLIKTN